MDRKRSLGGASYAPFLVALIPLNEQIDPQSALSILKACDPEAIVTTSPSGTTHITYATLISLPFRIFVLHIHFEICPGLILIYFVIFFN